MKRYALVAILFVAAVTGAAHAQQPPGMLLDPTQVDAGLTQALSDSAGQLGYGYVGDCALTAPDAGQVCSEVFQADDGSLTALLLDAANVQQAILAASQLDDGTWALTSRATAPVAAPVTPPAPPPVAAPRADPDAPTAMCPNGFIPNPGNGGGPTLCRDGLCSHSSGRGTCSGHGGVARRITWSTVWAA